MKKNILMKNSLLALSLVFAAGLNAQHSEAYQEVINNTNVEQLSELRETFEQKEKASAARVEAYIQRTGESRYTYDSEGNLIELVDIDNDQPIYRMTFSNVTAARTIGTQFLNNWSPVGLEGQGLTVGVWDGGKVRDTHQEFATASGSRAAQRDAATGLSSHATHVAGTVGASGVDNRAKGMAPKVNLDTYAWGNDASEMATAAANGLLISNHSYGQRRGWSGSRWYGDQNVSNKEDYRFGFYGNRAQDWDQIAYNAPFYLICKSAGNDRNDSGPGNPGEADPDGPWDCIGDGGIAKNILTVGAVNDINNGYTQPGDVVLTGFSSTGPADDGRVKPDIVANGSGLYSCEEQSDTDYGNKSGTSMSSPSAAGSLILLQELHSNTYNSFMRSATLKGLAIHTADEAGNTAGPDYEFGWGLLNMRRAAQFIDNSAQPNASYFIQESTLTNNGTYKLRFYADGSKKVKATVCWTDPASSPLAPSLDPRVPMLINDLDVRINRIAGTTTYLPYKLNPAQETAPATKGDNNVDNVEQVDPGVLPEGHYELVITHKGTLASGEQDFSLLFQGGLQLPTANLTTSAIDLCVGDSSTITNVSDGTHNTSWFLGTQSTVVSSGPSIKVGASSADTVTVKLLISNTAGADSSTVEIRFHELPDASFSADSVQCLPDRSVKRVFASNTGGTWFSPDPYRGGQWLTSNDSVAFTPSDIGLGTYPLIYEVTNSFGCTSRDTTNILFTKRPDVELSLFETVCSYDAPFTLSGGSPAGGTFSHSGTTSSQFNPAAATIGLNVVTYTYTDSLGCDNSENGLVRVEVCEDIAGVSGVNGDKEFQVYPNPVSSGGTISVSSVKTIEGIVIQDVTGAVILNQELVDAPSETSVKMPANAVAGIYFLVVKTTSETKVTRIQVKP